MTSTDNNMRESPAGMSMWGLYQGCPRKWAFKYALGFIRDGVVPEALVHGSAVHEGKKIFYASRGDIKAALDKSLEIVQANEESFESLLTEEKRLAKLFEVWYDTYGKTEFDTYNMVANEIQDEIVLPNGARITVRPDQILRDKTTGRIYILDTKTTGWSLEGTIAEYEFKSQPILYIASVYQANPGWIGDFGGWITDVMYQRVNWRKDGSLSSISTKCQRSAPIMYTEAQCRAFTESIMTTTSEVAYNYQQYKSGAPMNACFPMNRNACRAFNRTCPYWPICFNSYQFDDPAPEPFTIDPWKKEGIIDGVVGQIKL